MKIRGIPLIFSFLTIFNLVVSKQVIEFVAEFPRGCGFAYIAKRKVMDTLVQELNKHNLHSDYKMQSKKGLSEFNLLVRNKTGELIMIGTSEEDDRGLFLAYLKDSKSDKNDFLLKVIERLHLHKII